MAKISETGQLSKMPLLCEAIFMGQFMEFVRFIGNGDLGGLRDRRFRIHHQNLCDTLILQAQGPIFARNLVISPKGWVVWVWRRLHCFCRQILHTEGHIGENVEDLPFVQNALIVVMQFLWVNLWNSFYLMETVILWVYEVTEFESIIKIYVAPFMQSQGPIFAINFA